MKHLAFSICLLIFITLPLTATAQVVTIPDLNLRAVIEAALGKAPDEPITTADMARLTELHANGSNVSDLTGIEHATNLGTLFLVNNNISDISSLAGLTDLSLLHLGINNISDISPLAGLTDLSLLHLVNNNISDILPLAGLTDLTWLQLGYNNISDLSPLVANTGLGSGDAVYVDGNPLSYPSINTHIPTLQSRGVEVSADNLKPPPLEYLLSVPAGPSLIHVPLKVSAVDGVAKTIESISDLYDALGGAEGVNSLTVQTSRGFQTYLNVSDRGTAKDGALTDATGIIANMKVSTSVRLTGKPLGNNGSSSISLNPGPNLVGLPLRDSRINRVSDLLSLDGISGNVSTILLLDGGDYRPVGRAGGPGDIAITGGQGFILTAQQATTVTLSGEGWTNVTAPAAAPNLLTGLLVTNTTPVLALKGEIVGEVSAVNPVGFRVAVKNFSTGRQVATTAADAEVGYRLTVVDIETMRAAGVGDVLEISAQSTNPFIGVKPLRYTVTVEDVLQGWIQLPALVAYEIPKETELLANYPNPFNPETWIPYRLA